MRTLSLHRLIWAGVAVACVGLAANMAWSIWDSRERAYRSTVTSTDNLAGVLKQHTERILDSVEMLLHVVARELGPDSRDPVRRSTATASLAYLTQTIPHVISVRVLDGADRTPLYEFSRSGAPPRYSDVEAWRAHRDDPHARLHVSEPVKDPVSGEWLVAVSARINGRDGIPGNVVVAHLAMTPLYRFYDTLRVGPGGIIMIGRMDGALIARHPHPGLDAGSQFSDPGQFRQLFSGPGGSFEAETKDDLRRIFSYRRLRSVPLAIAVGVSTADIAALWVPEARRTAGLSLAVMALLLLVGRVLAREIRRRDRAEHALRSGEKRLRLALQAGRMVAWEIDPFTGAISRTENARGLMGPRYESAEAFLENVHPDDRDRVAAALLEAKAGRPVGLEYRYIRANGDVLWLEVRADQVGEEDGPRTVSGVTFDITERRRIEEDLRLAKEAAERAQAQAESGSRAKSEFLAVMSHEIRTPLNSIMGFTDLLLSRIELSPEVRRHLSLIRAAGSALLTVVNDVLDFSKIEAGAVELELGPFSPREVAEDCVSIVRDLAEQKGLEVAVAIDSTVLPRALGDQHRLRQILLNLLNNAVKFTETGRIVLEVTARDGAPGLTFAVRDTGIGIAAEKQPLLFQRFSQVDGSYSRSHGGTGLGLAICKHLVTLMGGEIGVESEAGRGSTFRFSIPAVPVEDHGEERAEPVLPPASAARAARILLVDDAEINLEIARAVLEGAGHRVDVARHGAQALAAVQESAYDIVLMDVQMPVMDGVAATRMIRDLKGPARDVPIIAMTANVYAEQVAHFLSAGMSGHVGKPFDRAELLGAVAAWARQDGRKIALPPAA